MLGLWILLGAGPLDATGQVVDAATKSSWVAGALAILVFVILVSFIWMIKHETTRHSNIEKRNMDDARERELRYAARTDKLEDALRAELVALVRTNTDMMSRMVSAADSICHAADEMMVAVRQFMLLMNSGACPMSDPARAKLWEEYEREKGGKAKEPPA